MVSLEQYADEKSVENPDAHEKWLRSQLACRVSLCVTDTFLDGVIVEPKRRSWINRILTWPFRLRLRIIQARAHKRAKGLGVIFCGTPRVPRTNTHEWVTKLQQCPNKPE